MRKIFPLILILMVSFNAYAADPKAKRIRLDTATINGNCNGATNVQECLEDLDNLSGGGEVNTASNLGGGLASFDSKNVFDLRFNSFDAVGFDLSSNLLSLDPEVNAFAPLTSAANKLPYYTGSGTAAVTDLTSFARSFFDDFDASAVRSTLGLVIGTDVQAFNTHLSDLSDGSLTGTKVEFADTDNNFSSSDVQSAIEEFDNDNGVGPNQSDYKVHWSQIGGMPSGFADGSDDGSGGGSDTNANWKIDVPGWALGALEASDSIPPLSKDAGTNLDALTADFDSGTDEGRLIVFELPSDATTGTVTFTIWWSSTATTGDVVWDIRQSGGDSEGESWDSALTTEAGAADAVQGTTDQLTKTVITETITNMGWTAGDLVQVALYRDANHASDTLAADARVHLVHIEGPRA